MNKKEIDVICLKLLECKIDCGLIVKFDIISVPWVDLSFTVGWEVTNLACDLEVITFEASFIHSIQEEILVAVEDGTVEVSYAERCCRG